jgi:hypothetical protein
MNAAVRFGAIPLALLLGCSATAAQPATPGAQAVPQIDWQSVTLGSPIPRPMPVAASDDPSEAGFARQWIERALPPPARNLASAIVARHRTPEDTWGYDSERELRQFIQTKVATVTPTISRVFCNSVGCLVYLERRGAFLDYRIVYNSLLGEMGHKLALRPQDGIEDARGEPPPGSDDSSRWSWELTLVRRASEGGPTEHSQTPGERPSP